MKSIGVWLLLSVSCSSVVAQSQRAVLVRADRHLADSSWTVGFRSAIATSALSGVTLLWPGAPVVQGVPDINQLLTPDTPKVTWQPIGAELSSDSTMGVTWGITVVPSSGTAAPVIGRYIAAWRREATGWRLAAIMLTDVAADGSTPATSGLPAELPPLQAAGNTASFVAADLAFARLAGDSGAGFAFERWAAPDAHTFVGGGILVEGPKAIGKAVSAPATWRWHPVVAGSSDDGSMGWTVGEAVITAPDGHSGPSKYLTVWKRQPDGAMRFFTDGGNGRPMKP